MKILITHDFLTTSDDIGQHQLNSLDFIQKLLCKIDGVVFEHSQLSRQTFFQALGRHDGGEKYLLDLNESCLSSIYSLARRLLDGFDLVIGYELTPLTRNLLTRLGVRYLDIWVSPIRFYRDVFFEMCSNDDNIRLVLSCNSIPDVKLFSAASTLANYTRDFLQPPNIKGGSLLIAAQLSQDKSVAHNGRFLSLNDFQREIFKLADEHEHTYLLKHPKADELTFSETMRSFSSLPRFSVLRDSSIYALLSSPNLKTVAGISSSVMAEARYFGKESVYLFKPVIPEGYFHIYESAYSLSFWCALLGCPLPERDSKLLFQDNDFRVSRDAVYGFLPYLNFNPTVQRVRDQHKVFARLMDYIAALNSIGTSVTVYGYGSVGRLIVPALANVRAVFDRSVEKATYLDSRIPLLPPSMASGFKDTLCLVSAFQYYHDLVKADLCDFEKTVNIAKIIGLSEE